jgi:quercetin dioxygenase-like cupin family protein
MKPVRRIVTGLDDKGQSTIVFDSAMPDIFGGDGMEDFSAQGKLALAELWATAVPSNNSGNEDSLPTGEFKLEPNPGTVLIRMVEIPPEPEGLTGARDDKQTGADSHPGFHQTETTDIVIMLDGELYAMMETGETLLKTGDVLIQRGTNHAWSNRSGKPAKFAGIMISARPKE